MEEKTWGGKRKGSGRPIGSTKENKVEYVKTSICVLPEELAKLKQLAKNEGKTLSRFIVDSII